MKKMITLFAIAGMVLALAPAAQAAPGEIISGVTATASSEFPNRLAADAVNGDGMVSGSGAGGTHNGTGSYDDGWQGTQPTIAWLKVDLGVTGIVGKMYVWNGQSNLPDRGAKTVDIYYATTDPGNNTHLSGTAFNTTGWTLWDGGATAFAQHPNTATYLPSDTITLNLPNVRYIALNITASHEASSTRANVSINELQFEEGTPAGPTVQLDGDTTGSVDENEAIGTVVGGIGTINTGSWGATNFAFAGGTDDASFTIGGTGGTNLLTAEIFDKETKDSYSIDVKADDGAGTSTTNTFTITIDNVVEAWGGIYASASVAPGETEVATLASVPGDNTGVTYTIIAGPSGYDDGAKFGIAGDVLSLNDSGDAVLGSNYWVTVEAEGDDTLDSNSLLIKVSVDNSGRGMIFIIE